MRDVRIAIVVCRCPVGQLAYNLERVAHWTRRAANSGAHIVCFPELNITGYSLSPPVESAQPLDGEPARSLQRLADEHRIVVLAGLLEKGARGVLYATHLVAAPGSRPQAYRKLHIAPPETGLFAAGDDIPVFKIPQVTFGVQLCYDAHFPELATHMALAGAELIFIPHASPRGTPRQKLASWLRHLQARAWDNGLFVAAGNQVGENGQGLSFPGVAVVIGPDGRVICQRRQDSEGMLLADLKAADLRKVRLHPMRFFLPHRRGDLYDARDS
jgi:N-carbamoylputrescine amidase